MEHAAKEAIASLDISFVGRDFRASTMQSSKWNFDVSLSATETILPRKLSRRFVSDKFAAGACVQYEGTMAARASPRAFTSSAKFIRAGNSDGTTMDGDSSHRQVRRDSDNALPRPECNGISTD
jgi:uncharacterized lipoprotein NlpE involved in copper resistance